MLIDFRNKLNRLVKLMEDKGASAIALTKRGNIGYLTGYEDSPLAIVSGGSVKLIVPLLDYHRVVEALSEDAIEVIPYSGYRIQTDVPNVIWGPGELENFIKGTVKGKVLVDAPSQYLKGLEVVDASEDIALARAVKTSGELEAIRRAIDITLRVLRGIYSMNIAGLRERDIAAHIYGEFIRLGADEAAFTPIVGSGPNGAKPHHTFSDRVIEPGDYVVLDVGSRVNLYCSDVTRTLRTGPVNKVLEDALNAVVEASKEALKAIKPGVKASSVDIASRRVIEEYGFGKYYIHSLGHGVGVEVHERPNLSPTSQDVLAPGNVITIEPGIYIRGLGGVRVENMVLVTDTGVEVLTRDELSYI